jgi:hypothetical protein
MTVLRRAGFHPEQLDEPVLVIGRSHELLSVIRIAVPRSEARGSGGERGLFSGISLAPVAPVSYDAH